MTGMKLKEAIKLEEVLLVESYPPEDAVSKGELYHYLLQPEEGLGEVASSHGNQVMYHLKNGLERVFIKEKLMHAGLRELEI